MLLPEGSRSFCRANVGPTYRGQSHAQTVLGIFHLPSVPWKQIIGTHLVISQWLRAM